VVPISVAEADAVLRTTRKEARDEFPARGCPARS